MFLCKISVASCCFSWIIVLAAKLRNPVGDSSETESCYMYWY